MLFLIHSATPSARPALFRAAVDFPLPASFSPSTIAREPWPEILVPSCRSALPSLFHTWRYPLSSARARRGRRWFPRRSTRRRSRPDRVPREVCRCSAFVSIVKQTIAQRCDACDDVSITISEFSSAAPEPPSARSNHDLDRHAFLRLRSPFEARGCPMTDALDDAPSDRTTADLFVTRSACG